MKLRIYRFLVSIFALGIFMAGCKSSTGPGSSNSVTVTRPGVGSIFISHYQEFDTAGRVIASKDEWDTDIVISSGIGYQGKTNVVAFRFGASPSGPVSYLNYELNGDVSIYHDAHGEPGGRTGWEIVPLASRGSTQFLAYDSTYTLQSGTVTHSTQTDTYTYTGEQNVQEPAGTFDASTFTFQSLYQDGYKDYIATAWFAPSIGWEVKELDSLTVPDADGAIRSQTDLVSYTLK